MLFAAYIQVHTYVLIGYYRDTNKPQICRKRTPAEVHKAITLKLYYP
jgi:hypothetical protein